MLLQYMGQLPDLPGPGAVSRLVKWQAFIFFITFANYLIMHFARKVYTNVKTELVLAGVDKVVLSQMDTAFMFAYAIGTFISGRIADIFPQNVVLGILPLWYWIDTGPWRALLAERRLRTLAPHVGRAALLLVTCALAFGLQPYQWWSSYGELFMVPQGDYYLRLGEPHVANLLFSSANGLFVWCPITYFAVAGLVLRARREGPRGLALPLLAVLVAGTAQQVVAADRQRAGSAAGARVRRYVVSHRATPCRRGHGCNR
jgi:hypothetical protein